MKNDSIIRENLKEAIDDITWYHINPYGELVEGAHGDSDALFKAEDIYKAIDNALAVENITVFTESPDEKAIADLKEELQKIIAEKRPQGEWIPVSERLPKQGNQSYLVTVDYGNGVVCSCQRFFLNDDIGWNDDCVIAWQPLPEPYKKGGKG